MAYDEESLFTGIRIGQTMKGWASFDSNGGSGSSDVASHIYPKAAKIRTPSVFPVKSFVRPAIRAAVVNVPQIIPVYAYEGGET